MIDQDDPESLKETLDTLADSKAMAGLRAGEADVKKGKTRSWKDVKRSIAKLSSTRNRPHF